MFYIQPRLAGKARASLSGLRALADGDRLDLDELLRVAEHRDPE
jgi:hypothetical protein